MKNILKFLTVIAMIFITACSEDIFLHDGEDGKDGHSTLMYYDEASNMKVYYLDVDDSWTYTPGDKILYSEPCQGFRIVKNDNGCYDIYQTIGTSSVIVATVCNGQNGQNGQDGHSLVIQNCSYLDDAGNILGQKLLFFWDMQAEGEEGYGIVSSGDIPKNIVIILNGVNGTNGQNGQDGKDGKTVMVSFSIIESSACSSGYLLVFSSSLDGTILSQVSICAPSDGINGQNGQDGINGLTPSLKTITYCYGVVYLWYIDKDYNGVYNPDIDLKLSENLITNGKDGNPATALVSLTLEYDFQGAGASYFNSTGFLLNEFVLNDGALYLDKTSGYVLLPPFSDNMDLLSLRFNYGSVSSYDLTVKAVYTDNTEATIKIVHLTGNPHFNRSIYSTYSQFEYYANLNSIEFKNVKRIKIIGNTSLKCTTSNLLIDQVVINLLDRNNH